MKAKENLVPTPIKAKAALIENARPNKEMAKPLSLEKLAQTLTKPQKDGPSTPYLNLKELSLALDTDDLKTPEGLVKFLKKPLGKKGTAAAMSEQALIQKEHLEAIQLQQREHLAFMHRLRALLFLLFFGKKAHASELIKEINRLVQEKLLHKEEPAKKNTKPAVEGYLETIAIYEKALKGIVERELALKAEEERLEKTLEDLKADLIELTLKHETYKASLRGLDNIDTDKVSKPELDKQVAELIQSIAVHAIKVSQAIAAKDENSHQLKHHHHGLNLQLSALKEIADVHLGLKQYVDEQGEAVTSFGQAHFILQFDQKIIKHDNKYYLLNPGQDWSLMNQQEKDFSQKNFEANKHDLMCIKQQLVYNENKEKTACLEQIDETNAKLEENKEQQLQLNNDRNLIQSEMAAAKNLESQPQLSAEMTPKATPTAGNASKRPTQTSTTQLFREKVLEMRQANKEFKHEDIITLEKFAPKEEKARLQAFMLQDIQKNPQAQKSFFKYLNSLNLSPLSKARDSKEKTEEKMSPFNPSPFPSPYKPY